MYGKGKKEGEEWDSQDDENRIKPEKKQQKKTYRYVILCVQYKNEEKAGDTVVGSSNFVHKTNYQVRAQRHDSMRGRKC